jgi:hypothetical protein
MVARIASTWGTLVAVRRWSTTIGVGGALPTVAMIVHGCREPTQLTLQLSTNVVCADMRGVDIVVAAESRAAEERAALTVEGQRFPTTTTRECFEGSVPRRIGTLVITPSGDRGALVVIAAFGKATTEDCQARSFAAECIVARRRFNFVEHAPIRLPVVLDPSCAGIPCNENSTCVGKKCVDSAVDCSGGTCAEPGVGPGGGLVEVDGASPVVVDDAASDAPADGSSAGTDGAVDAGGDAGIPPGGACPRTACLGNPAAACVGGGTPFCCYENNPATCTSGNLCDALAGCCRGAADCDNGDVCCADTPSPETKTRITCRSAAGCTAIGGVPLCSTAVPDCGGRTCLVGANYSVAPDYFHCS